ncbi:YcaO-like family protein [Candidatus Gracilibacteria bacterium]|nr:YcaO-like family protein [Candidatus Gracilibacteria bacterium]
MKIDTERDALFNNPGYIKLSDYINDIKKMRASGPWKLPLNIYDKIQLFILSIFNNISWFSKFIYIEYPYVWSPSYNIIVIYLVRKNILKKVHITGIQGIALAHHGYFIVGNTFEGSAMSGLGTCFFSKEKAFSKAVGELVEREVSGTLNEDTVYESGSFEELSKKHKNILYPPRYHRYLKIQKEKFLYLDSDKDTKFDWVFGKNIINNENVLIPKHLVFWSIKYKREHNLEKFLQHPTTNGSAGYFDFDTAIKKGIFEVVERDGFLTHWLTKTSPDIILTNGMPKHLTDKVDKIKGLGVDIYVLDITTNICIPSVCIVLRVNNSKIKQVLVCAGCDVTYEKAIDSALIEAAQCLSTLDKRMENTKQFVPFLDNLDKNGRVLIWQGEEWLDRFSWFISGDNIKYSDVSKNNVLISTSELESVKEILKNLGEEYYPCVYRPKNKILKKLGFCVVQVFIPICFPLYLVEKYGTFDSDRLRVFSEFKGKKGWSVDKINNWPHMFP